MRAVWVAGLFLMLSLAGCSEEAAPPESTQEDDFDDVEVEVTDDTGGIRGVVVNDAIVPVTGADVSFVADGKPLEQKSDDQGRFSFSKVPPGTYFLTISKLNHAEVQTTVVVEAGVKNPPIVKVQMDRLYEGEPFHELFQWQGYFTCAIAIGISTACVNDYTRLCGNVDPSCCPGGCAPFITGVVDQREYITELEANWQSIIVEMVWESSVAGTSNGMGMTMSYFARQGASHSWGCGSGPTPFLCRRDYEQIGGEDDFPSKIPPEGIDDLFIFMSAAANNIAIQQDFEIFHSEFFYGLPPEGWSFVKGDRDPFKDG